MDHLRIGNVHNTSLENGDDMSLYPLNSANDTASTLLGYSHDRATRLVFIVAMIIFSIAGFVGNTLIVVTITFIKDLRNTRNAFLVNLALSDLILIIVVVPFNIISVVHGAAFWKDKVNLCVVVASVCAPGCLAAIWSNTAVAVNRYVFICHNEIYSHLFSPVKTVLWVAAVWIIAFSIHFPNHVGWGANGYVDQFYLCTRETNLWTYSLFFGAVGIVLPLGISFYAYCRIYGLVRTTTSAWNQITAKRETKSVMLTDQGISITIGSSPENESIVKPMANLVLVSKSKTARKVFHREMLLVKTLFRSFAVFLVAWLPLAIMLMVPMTEVPTWIYLMTVFLAHGSTATNSLLYYATNEAFHRGFQTLVRRMRGQKASFNGQSSFTGTNGSLVEGGSRERPSRSLTDTV